MPTVTPPTGARYFSKGFNDQHAAPNFGYLWDSAIVWQTVFPDGNLGPLTTGAWRPASPSDFAANVNVSGLNLTVGAVAITGQTVVTTTGNQPVNVTNSVLAISGIVNTVVTGSVSASVTAVGITGFTSTISPLAISGVVQTNVALTNVTVTGFPATIAPQAVSGFFTPIWTGAPNVTTNVSVNSIAVTGFNSTIAPLAVSGVVQSNILTIPSIAVTGGNININSASQELALLSGISGSLTSNLSTPAWVTGQIADTVTGWNTGLKVRVEPISATVTSNSTPSGAYPYTGSSFFFGQALAANVNRIMFFVQNVHTGIPLYVNLGAAAASTGAFSFILNPSTIQGYAGSSFSDDHYRGAVQVSGGAWQAWEL